MHIVTGLFTCGAPCLQGTVSREVFSEMPRVTVCMCAGRNIWCVVGGDSFMRLCPDGVTALPRNSYPNRPMSHTSTRRNTYTQAHSQQWHTKIDNNTHSHNTCNY